MCSKCGKSMSSCGCDTFGKKEYSQEPSGKKEYSKEPFEKKGSHKEHQPNKYDRDSRQNKE